MSAALPSPTMPVTFVYRSHYDGPLSKRIVRFRQKTILAWFQKIWGEAASTANSQKLVKQTLGGTVYGFGSLLEAIREQKLPAPRSIDELRTALQEHLYSEGEIELDEHSLRVHTDDDEVELAYFLFDDEAAEPARVAYLLHDEFPLPDAAATRASRFTCPVETTTLDPRGAGPGRTWAVILTFYDSESFPTSPVSVFEGVRLPALLDHLRTVTPAATEGHSPEYPQTWPLELRLLRAAVRPDDEDLELALRRMIRFPWWSIGSESGTGRVGLGPQAEAWGEFQKLAGERKADGSPAKSLVEVSEHLVQAALHASKSFGYQQLFLFDDLWVAANRDLAASLLRYGSGWDPWNDDADGEDDDD